MENGKEYQVRRDGETIYTGDMAACFFRVAELRRDQQEYKGVYEIMGGGKTWRNEYKALNF